MKRLFAPLGRFFGRRSKAQLGVLFLVVIGEKGERLKRIGTETRQELEKLMECKVFIELWVKVRSGWADDEALLTQPIEELERLYKLGHAATPDGSTISNTATTQGNEPETDTSNNSANYPVQFAVG